MCPPPRKTSLRPQLAALAVTRPAAATVPSWPWRATGKVQVAWTSKPGGLHDSVLHQPGRLGQAEVVSTDAATLWTVTGDEPLPVFQDPHAMTAVDQLREFFHHIAAFLVWPVLLGLLACWRPCSLPLAAFLREAWDRRSGRRAGWSARKKALDEIAATQSGEGLDLRLEENAAKHRTRSVARARTTAARRARRPVARA